MRLFIAIELPDELKEKIRSVQNAMRKDGWTGNFSRPENLHVTLAFIGEYDDSARVLAAMRSVSFEPVTLTLSGMGNFGDIVWIGLGKDPQLEDYVSRLRKALDEAGIAYDRKAFKPHITILRKANLRGAGSGKRITASAKIHEVSLMNSERINGRLVYTALGTAGER